jgi:hypothetical protein
MIRSIGLGKHCSLRQVLLWSSLMAHAGLLAWGAARHSPHVDEVAHLAAGLSHWEFGKFRLFNVNPPLPRLVAAFPVWLAKPQVEWNKYRDEPGIRSEFEIGQRFLELNGYRSFRLFMLARWACIPFSLLGALFCYWWARELWGSAAGVVALVLWCFSPNVLAHGQTITPDVPAAALGIGAAWMYWKWLQRPTFEGALTAGLLLGIAQLCKTTWVILFVLWPLLWLCDVLMGLRGRQWRTWRTEAGQQGMLMLLAVLIINVGYGFEGSFRRLGDYDFVSAMMNNEEDVAVDRRRSGNRFENTWLASVPIPFPENYVSGMDRTKYEFEQGRWSYLAGEWRMGGWWYYYLYAAAIKVPLGTWLLLLASLLVGVMRPGYVARGRHEYLVLFIPLLLLLFVSSQTGFNHHLRYLLPAFPFVFVWLGQLARSFSLRHHVVCAVLFVGLAWSIGSSLWVYPHSMSYFNELVRGPLGGHYHLGGGNLRPQGSPDSNIDWGQDLLYLKRWLEKHPEAEPMHIAFNGVCDPKLAGIDYLPVPFDPRCTVRIAGESGFGPQPGWYAISVNKLHTHERAYDYFLELRPRDRVGYSIYIYKITVEDANRISNASNFSEDFR